jgi:hypothetical protein
MDADNGTDKLLRPPNSRRRELGTVEAIDNAIKCCWKGCYTSPFTFAASYKLLYETPRTKLPVYASIGHAGKNEALHSTINRLVDHISNIGEEQMEHRLKLKLCLYNFDLDISRNKRRPDAPLPWEEANALAPGARLLELPADTRQPFGWEYKRRAERQEFADILAAFHQLARAAGSTEGVPRKYCTIRICALCVSLDVSN